MRQGFRLFFTVSFLSAVGSLPCGAKETVKSGPQTGEMIPGPFHVINVNGEHAGNPHCLVCEYGLDPVVAIFTRERSATLKSLLQKVDAALERQRGARLHGFAVILSDDFAKEESRKKLIKDVTEWATEFKRVVVSVDGPSGPEKYNLNKDADLTVLLYCKHKVLANFAFAKDEFKDTDIEMILAAVGKMAATK
jgi:hypothetical protein